MNIFGAKSFAHGIHPPESKDDTSGLPIRQFPFAPVLVVPLSQHIGKPAVPVVREGQEVIARTVFGGGRTDFFRWRCTPRPRGVVRRIGLIPSISGKMMTGLFLEPFPASTQEVLEGTACDAILPVRKRSSRQYKTPASLDWAAPVFRLMPNCKFPKANRSIPW